MVNIYIYILGFQRYPHLSSCDWMCFRMDQAGWLDRSEAGIGNSTPAWGSPFVWNFHGFPQLWWIWWMKFWWGWGGFYVNCAREKKYVKIAFEHFQCVFGYFFSKRFTVKYFGEHDLFLGGLKSCICFSGWLVQPPKKREKWYLLMMEKLHKLIFTRVSMDVCNSFVSWFISPIYRTPNLWPFTSIYNPFTSVPAGPPKVVATPLKVSPLHIKRVYGFTDFWYNISTFEGIGDLLSCKIHVYSNSWSKICFSLTTLWL